MRANQAEKKKHNPKIVRLRNNQFLNNSLKYTN